MLLKLGFLDDDLKATVQRPSHQYHNCESVGRGARQPALPTCYMFLKAGPSTLPQIVGTERSLNLNCSCFLLWGYVLMMSERFLQLLGPSPCFFHLLQHQMQMDS